MFSLTKEQALKILKTALYIAVSALLDYLISLTTAMEFGTLTPFINLVLVTVRQLLKKS